jgi:hypothetical protein
VYHFRKRTFDEVIHQIGNPFWDKPESGLRHHP